MSVTATRTPWPAAPMRGAMVHYVRALGCAWVVQLQACVVRGLRLHSRLTASCLTRLTDESSGHACRLVCVGPHLRRGAWNTPCLACSQAARLTPGPVGGVSRVVCGGKPFVLCAVLFCVVRSGCAGGGHVRQPVVLMTRDSSVRAKPETCGAGVGSPPLHAPLSAGAAPDTPSTQPSTHVPCFPRSVAPAPFPQHRGLSRRGRWQCDSESLSDTSDSAGAARPPRKVLCTPLALCVCWGPPRPDPQHTRSLTRGIFHPQAAAARGVD